MERVEFNYKTREKRREALERSFGENLYKKHAACACNVCCIYVPKYQVYTFQTSELADLQAPSYRSTHLMIPLIERQDKNVKERSDRYKTKERYCKCKLGKASFKLLQLHK